MKKPYTTILSLVGMFFIIGLAIGLDVWMDNQRRIAMSQFTVFSSWLIPATFIEILFVSFLLIWLWFVYTKDEDHRISPLIFFVVGLGLLFYNYVISVSSLPLPMLMSIVPNSLSSFTSAIVAVVGLQRLIFKKPIDLS